MPLFIIRLQGRISGQFDGWLPFAMRRIGKPKRGGEILQAKFTTLSRLLADLVFSQRTKAGSFTRFDHADPGAWFLYPDDAPDEAFAMMVFGKGWPSVSTRWPRSSSPTWRLPHGTVRRRGG